MEDTQGLYYTQAYYEKYCDEPYENKAVWGPKFEAIADKIISEYNPKTILEIGCAMGYLVEAFRDRGVEAYGIDISEYAISKVREDIKPFCKVGSLLEELPKEFPIQYDLVITIEVIEHLYEDQVDLALDNLCKYSDQIIFSSSPDDVEEKTHFNVQEPEYWATKFALRGFYRIINSDLGYISKDACRYIKHTDLVHTIYDYEREIREIKLGWKNQIKEYEQLVSYLNNEEAQLKAKIELHEIENKESIKQIELVKQNMKEQVKVKDEEVKQKDVEIKELENQVDEYIEVLEEKTEQLKTLNQERQHIKYELDNMQREYHTVIYSTAWKMTAPMRKVLDITKSTIKNPNAKQLAYKGIITLKNEGLKSTLTKVNQKLKQHKFNQNGIIETLNPLGNQETINTILETRMRNLQKIPSIISNENITRLNLVTDSIEKHSLLGGVATALIVATEFANKYQLPLRIITRTTDINPNNYFNIMKLSNIRPAKEISFYSDWDRDKNGNKSFKLDVTPTDIFMATSWWSAAAIKKTTLRKRFYYIIQEVETYFYPHGDEHYMCSEIMEDKNIDYIINSHYLYDYFKENNRNIVENGIYFEPAFPKLLYSAKNIVKKDKYKLFFYARPNNPRNMFIYGLKILEACVQRGIINTDEWNIYCAGQDVPPLVFSNGAKIKNLGLMDWKEYSNFIKEIDLALSLMYTPHPSYPPFDVASVGGVVVTNKCSNKEEIEFSRNIILGDLEEEKFLKAMEKGIQLAKDYKTRKENFEQSTIPVDWKKQLKETIKFMGDKL